MADTHDTPTPERILIAYDGSPEAKHAISVAARLFPGVRADVVHAWMPVGDPDPMLGTAAWGSSGVMIEAEAAAAQTLVGEGTRVAAAAGLRAEGRVIEDTGSVAEMILAAARDVRPDVIVTGTRRASGPLGLGHLGSVARGVVAHSAVPVLVVPPPGA